MLLPVYRRDAKGVLRLVLNELCLHTVGRVDRVGRVLLGYDHLHLVRAILPRLVALLPRDVAVALRRTQRAVNYVFEDAQEVPFIVYQAQNQLLIRLQLLRRAVIVL